MSLQIKKQVKRKFAGALRNFSYHTNVAFMRPSMISIAMTNRCNSRCKTCTYWKNNSAEHELTTAQWKECITKLRRWYGPFQYTLGGGEPLMRKDCEEIISHSLRSQAVPTVITNGIALTGKRINRLVSSGLTNLVISLNGISADTHDFSRGMTGNFDTILTAIEIISSLPKKLHLGVAILLGGYNIHEAPEMVKWAAKKGVERISFQALFYDTGQREYEQGWFERSDLWHPRHGEFEPYIRRLIDMKNQGYPISNSRAQLHHFIEYFNDPETTLPVRCTIGHHGFFIEPDGSVKVCMLYDTIGNIVHEDPGKLWNAKKTREIRQAIKSCTLNCRLKNCNYVNG
jgi:MoaA/NifB/PqqE/SkfB family radical SAM enzyme